jgi:hypothetical protein
MNILKMALTTLRMNSDKQRIGPFLEGRERGLIFAMTKEG